MSHVRQHLLEDVPLDVGLQVLPGLLLGDLLTVGDPVGPVFFRHLERCPQAEVQVDVPVRRFLDEDPGVVVPDLAALDVQEHLVPAELEPVRAIVFISHCSFLTFFDAGPAG